MPDAGWFTGPDGEPIYWTGEQWLGSRPDLHSPPMPLTRTRRSNVWPGFLIVAGAVAVALATRMPWITVSGPDVSFALKAGVGVALNPAWSGDGADDDTRILLAAVAGIIACMGAFLIITRVRGLGVLWRIVALVLMVPSAILLYDTWQTSQSTFSDLIDDSTPGKGVISLLDGAARAVGVYSIAPANGLYLWITGTALVLLGLLLPARRYSEVVA